MVDLTQAADIPLVLTTLPQEIFVPPTLSGTQYKDKTPILNLMQATSRKKSEEGLSLDSTVAIFHYERAMHLQSQGKIEEAIESYKQSISWDLVPDSTPEINEIIRKTAKRNSVPLLDLREKAWAFTQKPGVLFRDSVHVNPAGAKQIAIWLREFLEQEFPTLTQGQAEN